MRLIYLLSETISISKQHISAVLQYMTIHYSDHLAKFMTHISDIISLLYKIFFVGLLLQFFAFNIVTFSLGLDWELMQYVWLWKELLILWLILLTVSLILIRWEWRQIAATREIVWLKAMFAIAVGITIWLNHLIHQLPRSTYALAFKYDFLGFLILFAWFHSSHFVETELRQKLVQRYGKILKIVLLLALGRYLITFVKPWVLKIFGYNNMIYEGTAGWQAPAVYYTHINQWLPRSSFLFERPTTFWFYLTAFFPLFYYLFLYGRRWSQTRARRAIYGSNILLTFSRAARGTRVIELIIIGVIQAGASRKNIKKLLIKWLLPLLLGLWAVSYVWYQQIFAREYSNTGHIAMLRQWLEMSIAKPLTWWWAASAGPGSHRNPEMYDGKWFNPENQFVQVFIEFGVIGFVPRFLLFLYLCVVGILPWIRIHDFQILGVTKSEQNRTIWVTDLTARSSQLLLGMSIWLVWLAASGMLLHSFVDRMVVYPFMLLFGIVLYHVRSSQGKIWTKHSSPSQNTKDLEITK